MSIDIPVVYPTLPKRGLKFLKVKKKVPYFKDNKEQYLPGLTFHKPSVETGFDELRIGDYSSGHELKSKIEEMRR